MGAKAERSRRSNLEGSVRKRKDGRWEGRIMVGYLPDGRPDRRSVYGKTKKEVLDKLSELRVQAAKNELTLPSNVTVAEYLKSWLETHRLFGGRDGQGIRPNTYRGYKQVIEKHIIPIIGRVKLRDVDTTVLEKLYAGILDKGTPDEPLRRTVTLAHVIMHAALDDAVAKDLLAKNPCDKLRRKPKFRTRAEERERLSPEQIRLVLDASKGSMYSMAIFLALTTGMRRGEICGLQWGDVDLNKGIIRVRRQVTTNGSHQFVLQDLLKTRNSYREFKVPDFVVQALREHKARLSRSGPKDFVCQNRKGTHLDPGELSRYWRQLCRQLGLPEGLRLHDLRGSWITWMAEQQMDPKTVASMAGVDPAVVWEYYQKVTPRGQERVAAAVADLFQKTV